jgi:hypothetical protein
MPRKTTKPAAGYRSRAQRKRAGRQRASEISLGLRQPDEKPKQWTAPRPQGGPKLFPGHARYVPPSEEEERDQTT